MTFKLGDEVMWSSASNGHTKTKHGRVVAVIDAGDKPYTWLKGTGMPRDHVSYVVEVGRKYYWPRVKWLRHST